MMLKVELHAHTSDDPVDRIPHSTIDLIDRAAALGYDALAITLHERQLDIRQLTPYAADHGIVLIPGIERTVEGRHVLLLNFESGTEDVQTFSDIARLKLDQAGLVIAPHPFFPTSQCLRGCMNRHAGLFDALEFNAMYTTSMNFNRAAERWAARHGTPIVGNGDVHRLHQLGTTCSLVDAEPDRDAICAAIREGRVRVESRPLTWTEATRTIASMAIGELLAGLPLHRPAWTPSLEDAPVVSGFSRTKANFSA